MAREPAMCFRSGDLIRVYPASVNLSEKGEGGRKSGRKNCSPSPAGAFNPSSGERRSHTQVRGGQKDDVLFLWETGNVPMVQSSSSSLRFSEGVLVFFRNWRSSSISQEVRKPHQTTEIKNRPDLPQLHFQAATALTQLSSKLSQFEFRLRARKKKKSPL